MLDDVSTGLQYQAGHRDDGCSRYLFHGILSKQSLPGHIEIRGNRIESLTPRHFVDASDAPACARTGCDALWKVCFIPCWGAGRVDFVSAGRLETF